MATKYLEKILKALGNNRRLAILTLLKGDGEKTVGEIAHSLKLSFTATSRHLAKLWVLDLVEKEQRSLEVFYSLPKDKPSIVRSILLEL